MTGSPDKPVLGTDYHKNTLEHDTEFHAFMDGMDAVHYPEGPPWRERLSYKEQRGYAKRWNFNKLYGIGPEGLRELLRKNAQKK